MVTSRIERVKALHGVHVVEVVFADCAEMSTELPLIFDVGEYMQNLNPRFPSLNNSAVVI